MPEGEVPSAKALLVNSSGNGLEYGTAGRVLNVQTFVNNVRATSTSGTNYNFFSVNYTQVKANSKILWWGQLAFRGNSSGEVRFQLLYVLPLVNQHANNLLNKPIYQPNYLLPNPNTQQNYFQIQLKLNDPLSSLIFHLCP